jgi:hypothetical protein
VCGVAGLILGLFTDWFTNDTPQTFWQYLLDLKSVRPIILLTIAIGTIIAFWLGKDAGFMFRSRLEKAPSTQSAPQQEGKMG